MKCDKHPDCETFACMMCLEEKRLGTRPLTVAADIAADPHHKDCDCTRCAYKKKHPHLNEHVSLQHLTLPGNATVTCPKCSTKHNRGPINGVDSYRCFNCGDTFRGPAVRKLVDNSYEFVEKPPSLPQRDLDNHKGPNAHRWADNDWKQIRICIDYYYATRDPHGDRASEREQLHRIFDAAEKAHGASPAVHASITDRLVPGETLSHEVGGHTFLIVRLLSKDSSCMIACKTCDRLLRVDTSTVQSEIRLHLREIDLSDAHWTKASWIVERWEQRGDLSRCKVHAEEFNARIHEYCHACRREMLEMRPGGARSSS